MTERQAEVRKAIASLASVGLKITGLSTHPETMQDIVSNEVITVALLGENFPDVTLSNQNGITYCGIPLIQAVK